jgi:hypothetical protein
MIEVCPQASELNALGLRTEDDQQRKSHRNRHDDDREGERIITAVALGDVRLQARRR